MSEDGNTLYTIRKNGEDVTVFTTPDSQIAVRGSFADWSSSRWASFLRNVKRRLGEQGVQRLMEYLRTRAEGEIPIVEDPLKPVRFLAAHSLEIIVSREQGVVLVRGDTYSHKDELRKLGFTWNSQLKAWQGPYPSLLEQAIEFVRKNDVKEALNPEKMVRCLCGRWVKR